jgi:hypothetical protein
MYVTCGSICRLHSSILMHSFIHWYSENRSWPHGNFIMFTLWYNFDTIVSSVPSCLLFDTILQTFIYHDLEPYQSSFVTGYNRNMNPKHTIWLLTLKNGPIQILYTPDKLVMTTNRWWIIWTGIQKVVNEGTSFVNHQAKYEYKRVGIQYAQKR